MGSGSISLEQALDQISELRKELHAQWETNHIEHCGRDWPHPGGKDWCTWPRPEILDVEPGPITK